MKMISFILFLAMAFNLNARVVANVHYMGDAKPINVSVPMINNKGGANTLENSDLTFNFDKGTTLGLNADFQIDVSDNKISISGSSINRSLIELNLNKIDEHKYIANIKFIPSEKILSPLVTGVSGLKYENGELTFFAGNLTDASLFKMNLLITRSRLFKKDEVIFNQDLTASDYSIDQNNNGQSHVIIDIKKITQQKVTDNLKTKIQLNVKLNYDFSNIINLNQLTDTNTTKIININ